jgi:L-lactate utilization protein LutB
LNKPSCINCKQPVGTIFERKYYEKYDDKTELIIFTAKCGNILNPCDLNIEIHKSLRENYDNLINENTEILNKYQMEIKK